MEYEEMREMEKTHCCAQCRGALVTAWLAEEERYVLRCAAHPSHRGYQRILTPSQALSRGELSKELGDKSQEDLEKMAKEGLKPLSRLPDTDLATNKPLLPEQAIGLITWGESIGLKPHLGHVCLYFGKPYVTIDGYYYLNGKQEKPFVVGTRPATKEEHEEHIVSANDYFYIAEAWLDGEMLQTQGLGIATKDEVEAKSERHPGQFRAPVVHEYPQRMAEKRAEWQLLRKLIPLEEQE